jgi:hypothetical protein
VFYLKTNPFRVIFISYPLVFCPILALYLAEIKCS